MTKEKWLRENNTTEEEGERWRKGERKGEEATAMKKKKENGKMKLG